MESKGDHPAATWGPRLCAACPVVTALSFIVGFLDPHGGENPIAATALAIAFVAAGVGLVGLFTCLFATERVPGFVRPRLAVPLAVGGIGGAFAAGLVGLIT